MSLALDLGLFLRNSKTKLGLTLSRRGLLFTLAIRIGNNNSTWIKQETLSKEVGVEESSVRKSMANIRKTKIILVEKQKQDKRKNVYRFNPILINYHLMNDEEKSKVHDFFDDEFTPSHGPKLSTKTKKYQAILPGNSGDTAQNCLVNTAQNCAINNESPPPSAQQPRGLDDVENRPKATVESNTHIENNRARKSSVNLYTYQDDFFPDEKRREYLNLTAKRVNLTEFELLTKFEQVSRRYKAKSADWQRTFEEFLARERPKKVYENHLGKKCRYDNQSLY